VEISKLLLEYFKVIVTWPLVATFSILLFRKELCGLLTQLGDVLSRINKADFPGISLDLSERMASQAKPKPSPGQSPPDFELSASLGGYSTEKRGIFIVVGIANRSGKPDQVLEWKLSFPVEPLNLEPSPFPGNIVSTVALWSDPNIEIPANRFVQGELFFRGRGSLEQGALPKEPLLGRITARTLHGHELTSDVRVYYLNTLRQNPSLEQ
jgi:hypothetical protein